MGREHGDLAVREAAAQEVADNLRDQAGWSPGASYWVTPTPRPGKSFMASNSKGSARRMNRAMDCGDR
jgi:hypothetical protein